MDWTDFVFPAKHVLKMAAGSNPSPPQQTQSSQPATQDIGKMAEDQARLQGRGDNTFQPHDQPTLQQLKGAGGGEKCPTCGK